MRRAETPREPQTKSALVELQRDNVRLRRENAKLKKRLRRYEEEDYDDANEEEAPVLVDSSGAPKCPECGSTKLSELVTPTRTITACTNCKTRL